MSDKLRTPAEVLAYCRKVATELGACFPAPVYLSEPAAEAEGATVHYLAVETPQVLAVNTDKREVTGLALPYDEAMTRTHYPTGARYQSFDPGSVKWRDNAAMFYGHDHLALKPPVGRVVSSKDEPRGSVVTTRIAKTAKGDEVHALMQPDEDGKAVLDRFSIGYLEVAGKYDADTDTYHHTHVDAFEVSTVPNPQYPSAKVESVLSRLDGPTVPNKRGVTMLTQEERARLVALQAQESLTQVEAAELVTLAAKDRAAQDATPATQGDVSTLSQSIETLERRLATLGTGGTAGDALSIPFHSYGDFLKAVAAGETSGTEFLSLIARAANMEDDVPHVLAYEGGVVADLGSYVKDTWVGELFKRLTERRRVLNAFTRRPLPASGMNVEYGVLGTDTTDVEQQVNEGDVLAYGKIEFATDTAPVKTYGGWSEMSRQQVERSAVAVVEAFFSALNNRYAKTTEAAVRTAAIAVGNATELPGSANTLASPDDWTDFVIDASFALDDNGLAPEFVLAGRAQFKSLAKMKIGGGGDSYFLDRNSGQISVVGLSGEIYNLPVIPVNANITGGARVCDGSAITTFEAGGAPFRLQDDDITNLTKAMSLYGYMAVAVNNKKGIIRPSDGV